MKVKFSFDQIEKITSNTHNITKLYSAANKDKTMKNFLLLLPLLFAFVLGEISNVRDLVSWINLLVILSQTPFTSILPTNSQGLTDETATGATITDEAIDTTHRKKDKKKKKKKRKRERKEKREKKRENKKKKRRRRRKERRNKTENPTSAPTLSSLMPTLETWTNLFDVGKQSYARRTKISMSPLLQSINRVGVCLKIFVYLCVLPCYFYFIVGCGNSLVFVLSEKILYRFGFFVYWYK